MLALIAFLLLWSLFPLRQFSLSQAARGTPPIALQLCESDVWSLADHSRENIDSFILEPTAGCFGAITRFPDSWGSWVIQESGASHADSWLAFWRGDEARLARSYWSGDLPLFAHPDLHAVRFEGKGRFIAVRKSAPRSGPMVQLPLREAGR